MCWAKHVTLESRNGLSDNIVPFHKEPTPKDWIVLNEDGVVSRTSRRATARGVVRDSTSNWVMGYNQFLGNCSIFDVELWGILDGLKLIQRRGHNNEIIHSDSLELVKVIHENVSKSSTSALIRRIHRILSQESQWILRYIPREDNKCADYLSKLAFEREKDLRLFESPPDDVLDFFKSDKERTIAPLEYFL
ncbi:uncharacterized protein LOC108475276 [Gossypium arboreum]|uniref:uncharacterized protein LOC108475276 n=1 Tax=Gossypium arboreum TaxID=29729 RepID=UPI000819645E|nr:uncharacterized protein LOC108475276 [Gossypium arboreum]